MAAKREDSPRASSPPNAAKVPEFKSYDASLPICIKSSPSLDSSNTFVYSGIVEIILCEVGIAVAQFIV